MVKVSVLTISDDWVIFINTCLIMRIVGPDIAQ